MIRGFLLPRGTHWAVAWAAAAGLYGALACFLLRDAAPRETRREGRIADEEMRTLDLEARELLDVCAPASASGTRMLPFFAAFGRLSMVLLVLLSPIVLRSLVGSWAVVILACATFFIVVGESTASVIENPFGTDPNALDLSQICQVIETTVVEILGSPPTAA